MQFSKVSLESANGKSLDVLTQDGNGHTDHYRAIGLGVGSAIFVSVFLST